MKKNRMMRLASVLLVCVLLTTSVISGTFAKYTTQDAAEDSARVAKWGVELQVVGNLYGETYKHDIVKDDSAANVFSVQANNAKFEDVVAPGTQNNEGFTFSLKGQPEVDGEVTTTMKIQNVFLKANTYGVMIPVDEDVVTAANFDEFEGKLFTGGPGNYTPATTFSSSASYYTLEDVVDTTDYYPVIYALAGNTSYNNGNVYNNTLKFAAQKIAEQLELTAEKPADDTSITYSGTKKFDANTNLADWAVDGLTLTWKWNFEADKAEGDMAKTLDKADTILGMLENETEGEVVKKSGTSYIAVVKYVDYCLDTMFSIDITVTQVD